MSITTTLGLTQFVQELEPTAGTPSAPDQMWLGFDPDYTWVVYTVGQRRLDQRILFIPAEDERHPARVTEAFVGYVTTRHLSTGCPVVQTTLRDLAVLAGLPASFLKEVPQDFQLSFQNWVLGNAFVKINTLLAEGRRAEVNQLAKVDASNGGEGYW